MSAIYEGEQLHTTRASGVEQRIERGSYGAAGIEHVVDQDDIPCIDVKADVARLHHRAYVAGGEIVAVEVDVQHAGIDRMLLDIRNHPGEALRQGYAAALDSDQSEAIRTGVLLDDFMCQPDERAVDLRAR